MSGKSTDRGYILRKGLVFDQPIEFNWLDQMNEVVKAQKKHLMLMRFMANQNVSPNYVHIGWLVWENEEHE